jgi:acetyl esterase/lipase
LNYYMTGEIEANKFKDNGKEMRKGNYYVSPYLAPKEILEKFPPTMIIATNYDEGIDDSVEFAKKLRSFKVDVNLKIFKDLHHGFLHFILVSGNLQI